MADQAMIDLGKQHAREDLNNIAQWIVTTSSLAIRAGGGDLLAQVDAAEGRAAPADISQLNFIDGWPARTGALAPGRYCCSKGPCQGCT